MQLEMKLVEEHPVLKPSKFWQEWNRKNAEQLVEYGFRNFKQHLALNYFTWNPLDQTVNQQIAFLKSQLSLPARLGALPLSLNWLKPWWQLQWPLSARLRYCWFVRLLWRYAQEHGDRKVLSLGEPWIGNPIRVDNAGEASQDLANASLEVAAIAEGWKTVGDASEPHRILELGAGYGRTAWALMGRFPGSRYVIVDVPPALMVSEAYLSRLFPTRKIFHARPWMKLSDVREELEASELAFLLPSQALCLSDNFVQLFVTISSLGEMRPDQIQLYFDLASRVTNGLFYFKQWKVSVNGPDGIVINQRDYPIPQHWRQLFERTAPVQTAFFEAAYAI